MLQPFRTLCSVYCERTFGSNLCAKKVDGRHILGGELLQLIKAYVCNAVNPSHPFSVQNPSVSVLIHHFTVVLLSDCAWSHQVRGDVPRGYGGA